MVKKLTAADVKSCKPDKSKALEIGDTTKGLRLLIKPSGYRAFVLNFRRPDGRQAKLTLGPVDFSDAPIDNPVIGSPLTLAAARKLAAELMHQRALGHDIAARHQESKRKTGTGTFPAQVERFIADHAQRKNRRWRETARLLGLAYPKDGEGEPKIIAGSLSDRWQQRDAGSITREELHAVVKEARRTGVPGLQSRRKSVSDSQGAHLFAALSKLYSWLHEELLVNSNPIIGLKKPEQPKPRDRVLTDGELRWFFEACDQITEPYGAVLKLCLLTGCRLTEVTDMRCDELSEDGRTLTLPGSRTKNKQPHTVYLSRQAREIIAAVRRIDGSPFSFTIGGRLPISLGSDVKDAIDRKMSAIAREERGRGYKIAHWRIHDLRRTCVTGMAELGIDPHIIETCVNHVSGHKAGVAGVYNRAKYSEKTRDAWQRWSDEVAGIVTGRQAEVIAFKAAAEAAS